MGEINECIRKYTNKKRKEKKEKMKKFNWKNFVIEVVKLALAFLGGTQVM